MYKDKFGRQYGFACPKGLTGPKGNYESNSDYMEEYFETYNKNILKRKSSEESLINLDPKDLEDNLTMGLIEWSEKQVLKDRLESEQEQLYDKVKKLEAFLTNREKLKDLKFKQIQLLHKQLAGMKTYLEALTERIKNL